MGIVLAALAILVSGGVAALAVSTRPRLAGRLGALSSVAGLAVGLAGAGASAIATSGSPAGAVISLRRRWDVPYGELALGIDPLSAFFLLIVFALCLAAAVYGAAYLRHAGAPGRRGLAWFAFNLLAASMAVVVMARNGVLFLVAWEVMAISSFLLVTFEDHDASVRDAGRLYLIATHTGTAFLLALFVMMARDTGTMDFALWSAAGGRAGAGPAGLMFLLAVVGFGTKAGLAPFHVWLPEAHPAAPSHVSAVISGAMLKMGIYGLLRALTFLGPAPPWWGAALIGLGVCSALVGVLFAMVQLDVKRLLAYSSVENVGLIAAGIGLGMIGTACDLPALAAIGFAGALLHTMNHALFKGLLFLGAGAVAHGTGTRQIDRLGGLLKRMPLTGACLLAGCAALTALPPFNGFLSEFLLYLASYRGVTALEGARGLVPLAALVGLALAGGLAAACTLRLAGMGLLGQPRSDAAASAREPDRAMIVPMASLAGLCLLLGVVPSLALSIIGPAVASLAGEDLASSVIDPRWLSGATSAIVRVSLMLMALALLLALMRRWLLARRSVSISPTWGCGYERPTPRMEYTASSFGEPVREMFAAILPARRHVVAPEGYFPERASFRSEVVRPFQERFYRPAFGAIARGMSHLRWLHHGRVQLYVLYIVVTLIAMLVWLLAFQEAAR